MKSILLTGVTGFVGSSLAARFLQEHCRVVALSRQDPKGLRTRQAVLDAAQGFGFSLSDSALSNLTVIDMDFSQIDAIIDLPAFQNIDEAWHVAAEMTYNPRKLESAIRQNLNGTYHLYRLLEQHSSCKRFYYVSTAYTAGMSTDFVTESLHLDPTLVNVYQTSKWSAEMSLAQAHQRGRLPVTIFRPSIVVGHQQTGWHGKSVFGMYSFVTCMIFAKHVNCSVLNFNIRPDAAPNLIPIDMVSSYAWELSKRIPNSQEFEVFHATASESLNNTQLCETASAILDINIKVKAPNCTVGRAIDQRVQKNAAFARQTWTFDMSRLQAALGDAYQPFAMDQGILKILIARFAKSQAQTFAIQNPTERWKLAATRLQVQRDRYESVARSWSRRVVSKFALAVGSR